MERSEHPYCAVNVKRQDQNQILYDTIEIKWSNIDNYTIAQKIGRGRYSHVFQGTDLTTKKKVAIKVLLPIKKEKIKREYQISKSLHHPHIIKLNDAVCCPYMKTASLVFEYFEHVDFRELYPTLTLPDIRTYMKQLLQAIDFIHYKGIMHRDIKPFNVLINPEKKVVKLIDFGLSQYYFPTKENNTKVASMYYKAPELFFSNSQYDYRVDIWGAGMILAGMIFRKTPFLVGNDLVEQILKVAKLVGTRQMVQYIKDYNLTSKKSHRKDNICFDILIAIENGDIKETKPSNLEEFITKDNEQNATPLALDLIKKMLTLDFKQRINAKNALEHPFFDEE